MSNLIRLGPQYFPKSEVGTPTGAGSLYIGDVDTDPTITGNQKTVQALQESGSLITVSQPITLSAGGIPLYNGSPVSLYTEGNYSLTVLDINGAQVYYVPSTPGTVITDTLTVSSWPANNNIAQFDGAKGLEDSGESITEIGVLDTAKEWTGQQNFNENAITSGSNAVAWDLDAAQCAVHTLTENTTISEPTNMNAGGTYVLRVVQAAGVYTLDWNAAFVWGEVSEPGEPAADGDVIIISFYSDGTSMYGVEFLREEA